MDGDLASRNSAIDALVRAIAPVLVRLRDDVQARLDAFEAILAERMAERQAQTDELLDETRRRAEDAIRQSAEAVRSLAALVIAETRAMPDRLTQQVAMLPRPRDGRDGYLTIAHNHVAGRVYDPGEIARHRGGTWQAIDRTGETPGPEATTWRILADGLHAIDIEQPDPRAFVLGIDQSDGLRRELTTRFPIPLHRRAYAGDASYEMGDEVALDGSSWRCVVERASTSPPSPEWALIAQRGGRGKQGERGQQGEQGVSGVPGRQGEPGDIGPPGSAGRGVSGVRSVGVGVIQLIFDDEALSAPIDVSAFRYRGGYKPGETYGAGDVVRLGFNLWIALVATETVPLATSPDWALFLPGVEPSSGGGNNVVVPNRYRGLWQVATNDPDLLTGTFDNSDYFACVTVDPSQAEMADPAIPGIGGQLIGNGDWILWSELRGEWQRLAGTGISRPEADDRYVNATGDTMTGGLTIHTLATNSAVLRLEAGTNSSTANAQLHLRNSVLDSGFILSFIPSGPVDQLGFRIVRDVLGSQTTPLHIPPLADRVDMIRPTTLSGDPVATDELARKAYVDSLFAQGPDLPTLDDRYVNAAGDTMTGTLHVTQAGSNGRISLSSALDETVIQLNSDLLSRIAFHSSAGPRWAFGTTSYAGQDFDLEFVRIDGAGVLAAPLRIRRTGGVQIEEELFFHKEGDTGGVAPAIRWADDGGNLAWVYASRSTVTGLASLIFRTEDPDGAHTLMRSRPGDPAILDDPSRLELMADPVQPQDAATRRYIDALNFDGRYVNVTGDTMTGALRIAAPLISLIELTGDLENQIRLQTSAGNGFTAAHSSFNYAGRGPGFFLVRTASGAIVDAPVHVSPTDSRVTLIRPTTWTGDPLTDDELARRAYVDQRVARAGDTMTGALAMGGNAISGLPMPAAPTDAASRAYVDQAVTSTITYQGQWRVATNQPNLITWPTARGDYFVAQTAGANIPEQAPGGIPGIGGEMIADHDWIIWSEPLQEWERISAGGLTRVEADATYVRQGGDRMSGALTFVNIETGINWSTSTASIRDTTAGLVLRRAAAQAALFTEDGAGANRQPLLTQQAGDARYAQLGQIVRTWAQGAVYAVNDLVYWDNLLFRVTTAIAAAPATPDFATIRIHGASQGDYFSGAIPTANWIAGNWVHLATMPAYGSYRLQLDFFGSGGDNSLVLEITTTFGAGSISIVSYARNPSGVMWRAFRLSAAGGAGNAHRIEAQINTASATPDCKLFVAGFARQSNSNQTNVQKPPIPVAGGANLGGTQYALIEIPVGESPKAVFGNVISSNSAYYRFSHATVTDANDGKIGARIFSRGLNIVGVATEAGDTQRYIRLYGQVEMAAAASYVTDFDGHGFTTFGGGRFYKASGTGLVIRCHTGNTQPQIEDNSGVGTTRRFILDARNTIAIGEPTAAGHIATRAYVDNRRGNSVYGTTNELPLTGGAFTFLTSSSFPIPRGGNSRLLMTVHLNFSSAVVGNYHFALRAGAVSGVQKHIYAYNDGAAPGGIFGGASVAIPVDVAGTNPLVSLYIQRVSGGNVTVVGTGDAISSYALIDLGPR